ncbi:MAG: universal stress protein [bacterium]|nr:universal stress protein [bacterium]
MKRFRNILFASVGGKDDFPALDRANRLAQANHSRMTLVYVVEELPKAVSYFLSKRRIDDLRNGMLTSARQHLDALTRRVDDSLKVETRVLVGTPFIELIRTVVEHSHDLIIKATQPGIKGKSLQSTDLHLLRKCPGAVWLIKSTQRKPFGKIMVAVDPDPSDADRLSLHTDLLKLGTSLADAENGMVEIVHTWTLDGEAMLRGPRFKMAEEEIEELADQVASTRKEWLDKLLAPYDNGKIKVTLTKGLSGPTLVEIIEKRKPDIVVMGTVARTGLPGLLIGNTAESVLQQISCSVLTIKPKGFKTPVS